MTSLIFGSIYMGHQAVVGHRRDKQREKNYQRWEGLRDEYDEQKRHSLDSNLDRPNFNNDSGEQALPQPPRELFTLRDRQEAGDARTSWRTQESWSHLQQQPRHDPSYTASAPMLPNQFTGAISRAELKGSGGGGVPSSPQPPQSRSPSQQPQQQRIRSQKTGATWDEALPARLQVTRRSFEDYTYPGSAPGSGNGTSTLPQRQASTGARSGTGSAATSSAESLVEGGENPLPKREPPRRRVEDVEVVESPFEWWKQ